MVVAVVAAVVVGANAVAVVAAILTAQGTSCIHRPLKAFTRLSLKSMARNIEPMPISLKITGGTSGSNRELTKLRACISLDRRLFLSLLPHG